MSDDPLERLPLALGKVVARCRLERGWSLDELVGALGGREEVDEMFLIEQGHSEPTLTELFRFSRVFGMEPSLFVLDVIAEWRGDGSDGLLYRHRACDFARRFTLGFYQEPGGFRELPAAYQTFDQATAGARATSIARRKKFRKPVDTICMYVRLATVRFTDDPDDGAGSGEAQP